MDLTKSIEPRSDQLNADDLMAGPRTVTIVEVRAGNAEQPVEVVTQEFGPGRPFKPSKSMRRVMVAAWGPESSVYPGRKMTLFRDPTIRFGKDEVGGIRISHMSHLEKAPLKIALTVTRGKRAPFVVQALADEPAPAPQASSGNPMTALTTALEQAGIAQADWLTTCASIVGRDLASSSDLTEDDAARVIAHLEGAQA